MVRYIILPSKIKRLQMVEMKILMKGRRRYNNFRSSQSFSDASSVNKSRKKLWCRNKERRRKRERNEGEEVRKSRME